ncbi:MAG: 30S ribosomal protein S8 [candidate division WS2 bacterium ADurb.Bin280]|uniref:Small ribosomal subunit protein uS8 n=1 Tax=candidate division WS2 bacterium ADurb.Bin280 TaxID=1852829 RepID=A0A1V5SE62_9BACT|nr:MAG: 30S ribosomal protein S8 [candidate division WS2 bacterium ADurb.Bin280]
MSDTIADLINRINNAAILGKQAVVVPYSNQKMAILSVLKEESYISDFKADGKETINIILENAKRPFAKIYRVSKPGRKVYIKSKDIRRPKGYGVSIISTPMGVLSGSRARKNGVGGELICEVI